MIRQWTLRIALALLVFMLALLALLLSPWGARFVLGMVDNQLEPLTIEYASGGLASQLKLDKFSWQDDSIQLTVEQANLSLDLGCLFSLDLCFDHIRSGAITVTLPEAEDKPADASSDETINLPVGIKIRQLKLGKLNISMPNQWQLSWQSLDSQLEMDRSLRVNKLTIAGLDWQQLSAASGQQSPSPGASSSPLDFTYQPITLPPVSLPLAFNLQAIQLTPVTINLTGSEPIKLDEVKLAAHGKQHKITLSQLVIQHQELNLSAQAQASLTGNYPYSLSVKVNRVKQPYQEQKLSVNSSGDLSDVNANIELSGKMTAKLQLQTDLTSATLPMHVQANWQHLRWPLEQPQYQSASGKLLLDGDLNQARLQASALAQGQSIPALDIEVGAQGNQHSIKIDNLLVKLLRGEIQAQGQLDLRDQISWLGGLQINHIHTEQFWPELQSNINGSLQTHATYTAQQWHAKLTQLDITGQWQSYPLSITGNLDADSQQGFTLENLLIHNGDNQLMLDGTLDAQQQLAMHLDIQAADLTQLMPGLAGAVTLQGQANGSLDKPLVEFELSAQQLQYSEWNVAQLRGQGNLQWNDIKPVELSLHMDKVTSANHQLDYIDVNLAGNADNHQLSIDSSGEQASFLATLHGQLLEDQWLGEWQQGKVMSNYARLTLQQPFDIQLDWQKQRYQISPHCWQQEQSSLCINEAEFFQDQAHWDIALQNLPIMPLVSRLVPSMADIQSASQLSLQFNGDWDGQGLPQAELHASLSADSWRVAQAENINLAIDQFEINASVDQQQANLKAQINGQQIGQLNLDVQIDPRPGDRALAGTIKLNQFDLHPFMSLLPSLDRLAGVINADTRLEGKLTAPLFYGTVSMHDGELSGNSIPVVATHIEQNIQLQGQYGDIQGRYQLGSGKGEIAGRIDWLPEFSGELTITGQDLELTYQNMLRGTLSPDIKLDFDPASIDVSGQVQVPYARIKLRDLPDSAVSPSSDVVIVNDEKKVSQLQQRLSLNLQVQIDPQKRNEVKLDAFGLTTDLRGEIDLQQVNNNLLGNGEISLHNGRYRAYGQNLLIRDGQILFHGPLDSPHIALEAVRDPALTADNVTAGIRVNGSVDRPEVSVFSDPAMEQPQSLSYLLRGRALDSGNDEGQDALLTTMLLGFGVGRTENMIGTVGSKLGVDDLTLDTSGQGDSTQLALTGYIAPGVQLRYGLGVFNSASEIALRYELMPQLYLEAVSGLSNALDLYYSFSIGEDKEDKDDKSE
ncbi:autotransporter assembly complex protein TamB [Neptunicella sp.]|uniref:autotransporter assembly complex protein TamB n=1 Tax=Neptunicella sp. TaxID=2125986 RepID=UPI003F693CB5